MGSQLPRKFKVAIVQMKPKPLDPEANFAHASSAIREAANQGAALAILPEYHLTAWEPNDPKFISIAQTARKYQDSYQSLAAELKVNICTGTIVQTPAGETPDASKPTLLNISAFISSTGELLGTYIKTNIWIPEREHLTSSVQYAATSESTSTNLASSATKSTQPTSAKNLQHAGIAHSEPSDTASPHTVINTPLGKIGILICWDLAFPEAFRSLILQGCELVLLPTYWTAFDMKPQGLALNPDAEKLFVESTLVARAFENTCTIVFCNAGGPNEEGFLGLSGVYAPIVGRVPPSFVDGEEGLRIVEIDLGIQDVAEENYRVREDLGREGWHYGYEKGAAQA